MRMPRRPLFLHTARLLVLGLLPWKAQSAISAPAGQAFGASAAVRVSGPSPLAPGCTGPSPQGRIYRNSVVEPYLAVDPRDPRHLVGAWQQDRWATGGASGQVSAVSWDGGQTWTQSSAAFTRCQGGSSATGTDYERATDPWLTFTPNGVLYQMTVAYDNPRDPASVNGMLVSRSTDGGVTWQTPVTLIRDRTSEAFNDKNSITADPTDSNYVYAVWHRDLPGEEGPDVPFAAPAMLARTTDGGRTWEPARVIYEEQGVAATGNIIVVLPDGVLVDVFVMNHIVDGKTVYDLAVIRSADRGVTWSAPAIVARMNTVDLVDPYSTFTIRPTPDNIPSAAVDPRGGQLYITWTSGDFSDGARSDVALSTSTDSGLTWTAPVRVNPTPGQAHAFVPTIAVLANGTVGLSYFDLRNNTPLRDAILADHWLLTCAAGVTDPANWRETHIAGPFDMQRAPYAYGFFVGDYMGLAAAGDTFALLYVTTTPEGDLERTAAYFTTVTPP